jgi:tRNA(Ile)-lysidine synthase
MYEIKTESRVADFIQEHDLISPGDTVVVGVSGGEDSVCLLHILAEWQKRSAITLHVAHLDHQLRGPESDADAEYVSHLASSLGIPVTVERQDVSAYRAERNCSVEEAAREVRYRFLAAVASDVGARRIAVGHTRDDHVETILMHILRGTGISGLSGLAPSLPLADICPELRSGGVRTDVMVIRPLLGISGEESAEYCRRHGLKPRVDSSNLSPSCFRNRIRLHLLPVLREYSPGVDKALLRLADIAREDVALIQQQASEVWDQVARQDDEGLYLSKKAVLKLPVALQRQLLLMALARLIGNTRDIEAVYVEEMRGLLAKQVGKRLMLPRGLTCEGGYDELVVRLSSNGCGGVEGQPHVESSRTFPALNDVCRLDVPGETLWCGWRVTATVVSGRRVGVGGQSSETSSRDGEEIAGRTHGVDGGLFTAMSASFDLDRTGTDLIIRKRGPGDRFRPLGMSTEKKLQDFMVDAKIPRSLRDHVPIVCSWQHIIWVVGWRIDDRVRANDDSRPTLYLEFRRVP